MSQKSFNFIEDYIEYLSGCKTSLFQPSVKLARYDEGIVYSFAAQLMNKVAFTDRQAALAVKLVSKYKKQLSKLGVDVKKIDENPVFKYPPRTVDRERKVKISDNMIVIKFPFDPVIVDLFREINKNLSDIVNLKFDNVTKCWTAPISEQLMMVLQYVFDKYNFSIDESYENLFNQIKEIHQSGYSIELCFDDNGELYIKNSPKELQEYVENTLGGLHLSNVTKLVDCSKQSGYTVSDEVINWTKTKNEHLDINYLLLREHQINDLAKVFLYLKEMNRFPVYIYAVNKNFIRQELIKYLSLTEISNNVIYISKLSSNLNKIPALITTDALLAGFNKQHIKQISEKIFFYTDVVYHKLNT
jgi:hypothetical protein